jgi:hypothetical protein
MALPWARRGGAGAFVPRDAWPGRGLALPWSAVPLCRHGHAVVLLLQVRPPPSLSVLLIFFASPQPLLFPLLERWPSRAAAATAG